MNQTETPDEKRLSFLTADHDNYAILQLNDTGDAVLNRFSSLSLLKKLGLSPDIAQYDVVYSEPLPVFHDLNHFLDSVFERFNIQRPEDFKGHSLSVSDIIAIRHDGVVSCHYVDSIGFQELPGFLKPENYLRNAEMAMEDDYGMVDGIINNGKSAVLDSPPSIQERLQSAQENVVREPHPKVKKQEER